MTTTQTTTTPESTYDDLSAAVAQLATQVADLTAQLHEARETACRLQQERDQEKSRADANAGRADFNARMAGAFRNGLDDVRTELRNTRDVCRELAVVKVALEMQIDRMQNPPEPRPDDHTRRWPFRHGGNQL